MQYYIRYVIFFTIVWYIVVLLYVRLLDTLTACLVNLQIYCRLCLRETRGGGKMYRDHWSSVRWNDGKNDCRFAFINIILYSIVDSTLLCLVFGRKIIHYPQMLIYTLPNYSYIPPPKTWHSPTQITGLNRTVVQSFLLLFWISCSPIQLGLKKGVRSSQISLLR